MFGSEYAAPVLMVIGAAAVALFSRRVGPLLQKRSAKRGLPRHLGTLMLNPKCSVALIEAGRQTLLVGLTASSVTLLAKLPPLEDEPRENEAEADAEVRLQ
jgi:flagellar biogenesis protein FliO